MTIDWEYRTLHRTIALTPADDEPLLIEAHALAVFGWRLLSVVRTTPSPAGSLSVKLTFRRRTCYAMGSRGGRGPSAKLGAGRRTAGVNDPLCGGCTPVVQTTPDPVGATWRDS